VCKSYGMLPYPGFHLHLQNVIMQTSLITSNNVPKSHCLQLVTLEVGQKSGHSVKLTVGWAIVLTLCDSTRERTHTLSLSLLCKGLHASSSCFSNKHLYACIISLISVTKVLDVDRWPLLASSRKPKKHLQSCHHFHIC